MKYYQIIFVILAISFSACNQLPPSEQGVKGIQMDTTTTAPEPSTDTGLDVLQRQREDNDKSVLTQEEAPTQEVFGAIATIISNYGCGTAQNAFAYRRDFDNFTGGKNEVGCFFRFNPKTDHDSIFRGITSDNLITTLSLREQEKNLSLPDLLAACRRTAVEINWHIKMNDPPSFERYTVQDAKNLYKCIQTLDSWVGNDIQYFNKLRSCFKRLWETEAFIHPRFRSYTEKSLENDPKLDRKRVIEDVEDETKHVFYPASSLKSATRKKNNEWDPKSFL